jgi:hypothetical protein
MRNFQSSSPFRSYLPLTTPHPRPASAYTHELQYRATMSTAHHDGEGSSGSTDSHIPTLEALPTEIIQQVASYLIREDHDIDANRWDVNLKMRIAPVGICQLRAASKTLRSKTQHVFPRCLAVKVVAFDMLSLVKLFDLAMSESYASRVQSLVFVAPRDKSNDGIQKILMVNHNLHNGAVATASSMRLPCQQATEVLYMMIAFRLLQNLQTVIVSSSIQHCYPASVRQSSLAKHPPTMILAAAMASKAQLQHIIMCDRNTGAAHGVKPRILDGFLAGIVRFNTLKTISLVLPTRNCKFLAIFSSYEEANFS